MPSSKQSVEVCLCISALVGQCVKISFCLGFILPVAFMMFWMQTHIYFSIIKWDMLCLQTENTETSYLSFITISELLESAETFYLENYCNFYKKKIFPFFVTPNSLFWFLHKEIYVPFWKLGFLHIMPSQLCRLTLRASSPCLSDTLILSAASAIHIQLYHYRTPLSLFLADLSWRVGVVFASSLSTGLWSDWEWD